MFKAKAVNDEEKALLSLHALDIVEARRAPAAQCVTPVR